MFSIFDSDTVNVAARMESNGKPNQIHVSQETADALLQAGKSSWIQPREDVILAKGKGELKTFWLTISNTFDFAGSSHGSVQSTSSSIGKLSLAFKPNYTSPEKHCRLIEWNTEVRA